MSAYLISLFDINFAFKRRYLRVSISEWRLHDMYRYYIVSTHHSTPYLLPDYIDQIIEAYTFCIDVCIRGENNVLFKHQLNMELHSSEPSFYQRFNHGIILNYLNT